MDKVDERKVCPTCGRIIITDSGDCIKAPHNYIEKQQYSSGTDSAWICKKCLLHVPAGIFHVCPTWENFESEPE